MKIEGIMNFIGGVSGLASLLAVAVWGGEVKRQVTVNTGRLDRIESFGSATLRAHETMDDQRVSDLARRVTNIEDVSKQLSEIRGDVRVINGKIDVLADEVKTIQTLQRSTKGP